MNLYTNHAFIENILAVMKCMRESLYLNSQKKQSEDKHRMSFKWCWQIKEYPVYEMKLTPQRPDEL